MRPKTIGLIVNPKSGQGEAYNLDAAQRLVRALNVESVVTGPGPLGEAAIPTARVLTIPSATGRNASQAVALAAMEAGVEALVVIGGDGTLSDIAFAVYQTGSRCPILGIGAGSINAGDLIACQASQIEILDDCDFQVERVNALEAGYNGQILALAFNDVVIGTTIVGTVDGAFQDLDANAFMAGSRVQGEPRPIGTGAALVTKRGGAKEIVVSAGWGVGTVVVGFTHYYAFFGKAIIGGVGLSSLVGAPAGCIVCEQALVRTQLDAQKYQEMEPIHSSYVSLNSQETLHVTGLDFPAVLCADGNPLAALRPDGVSYVRVRRDAVDVLRVVSKSERSAD